MHVHLFDIMGYVVSECPRQADSSVAAQSQLVTGIHERFDEYARMPRDQHRALMERQLAMAVQ
jgi:hypothetical protein